MYGSNLSWNPLNSALESMIKQNLIKKEERRNRLAYYVTKKGKEVLNYFKEATNLIEVN